MADVSSCSLNISDYIAENRGSMSWIPVMDSGSIGDDRKGVSCQS
jgi:hypothetical protein